MKKILICFVILSVLPFYGCEDLEAFNENPNVPETVAPQFLLSNVIYTAANNNSVYGWHAGNLLAQYTANLEFLPVDRYDLGSNTALWNDTYRLLNDLHTIVNAPQSNEAYQGVSMILEAQLAALLTDLWTDVPYFNAIKGAAEGNFTPAFDSQEAIYTVEGGILDLLRKAVPLLENTNDQIAGDILYNGDLQQWVKFANALRVRYLMRVSKHIDVSEELQTIVDSGKLMQSNADNAVVPYLAAAPNQWVIYTEREGRYTDVRMSTTSDSILTVLNDPRIGVLFKPTASSMAAGDPQYEGIPNGLSRESQLAYDLSEVSLVGAPFRDVPDGTNAMFMQYSELQFALAEAVLKGFIAGSANAYYQQGIIASFAYYQTPLPDAYLSSAAVALNGSDDLNKIITQKWVSLFLNGYEGWRNYRRTGFPVLTLPVDNLNNDVFPVRYQYPESEQAVNNENYQEAVSRIGGDNYNSKGWWEK